MEFLRKSHVPDVMDVCTFNFCARVAEPYIYHGCTAGLEMEIIYVLQSIMKFKVFFPPFPKIGPIFEIYVFLCSIL